MHFFEPVTSVLFSFWLTFPLTTGMTIIFLVLFNMNWKKLTFITVTRGPAMFVIFFLLLNVAADRFGLHNQLKKAVREQSIRDSMERVTDSLIDPKKYQDEARERKHKADQENQEAAGNRKQKEDASNQKVQPTFGENQYKIMRRATEMANSSLQAKKPWYDNGFVNFFVSPTLVLYRQLRDFYDLYGPARFISGIILAFILAAYIQYHAAMLRKRAVQLNLTKR